MKPIEILVFGATGQIGRNLLRKLTKNNCKVTAVTRNAHRKGYILKKSRQCRMDRNIVELEKFDSEILETYLKEKMFV